MKSGERKCCDKGSKEKLEWKVERWKVEREHIKKVKEEKKVKKNENFYLF